VEANIAKRIRDDCQPILLVVDDELGARRTIEALLAAEPYALHFASNGGEGLDAARSMQPDVILLDVMMPGMDGFETCRALKADPRLSHIPTILVTALDGREYLVRGLEAGADDFLTKPVSGVELKARVRSMLRIKRQYDDLADTLRLRDELAHLIVHDMRSPIMAVLTYAELLETAPGDLSENLAMVRGIRDAANRLNGFSNEILMTSKIEHGQFLLKLELVEPCELGRAAMARFVALAGAKKVSIAFEADTTAAPSVQLDRGMFERVLDNLLSNAVKFSPPDSAVSVVLDYPNGPGGFRLRVADHGVGVAPEDRARVLEKFGTAGAARTGQPQVGLGLYFCRLVVEAHGGTISLDGNTPSGTVVTIEM
jgi:signal transduction histidine kinase